MCPKKEIEKPSERTYNEAILYGSALNDVKILLCKGSLWYCKRCLSLDESLVCVNEKSSTKKSGQVELPHPYDIWFGSKNQQGAYT